MTANKKLFTDGEINDVISFLPYPAHIKDSDNGKYICVNVATLNFFNLQSQEQLIGLTVKDLDRDMNPYWGTKFANDVELLEYEALDKKEKVVGDKHTILLPSGKLMIQQMEKIPIIDNNGKASSILTVSHNLISKLTLSELYPLYKNYFKSRYKAINGFLNHIDIETYFTNLPTENELMILISLMIYDNPSEIAAVLNFSPKVVSKCAKTLQDKIKNKDITNLLIFLRSLRQF